MTKNHWTRVSRRENSTFPTAQSSRPSSPCWTSKLLGVMDVYLTTVAWDFISFNSCWKRAHPSYWYLLIEGSSEVKLPTIWTDGKAEVGRVREEKKKEDKRRERVSRKKMQVREKFAKSRNTVFFQWFVAPEGRKVGSLKRQVQSHLGRWEMKNCTPLWRKAHFQVKTYKAHHGQSTFGSWDVQKAHAVVAQSTFRSQKC